MSDRAANFAKTRVIGNYLASDLSIQVEDSGRFPVAPFNATWWNSTDYADPSDDPEREIVRITGITISGSVQMLTITRAQENTTAVAHNRNGKVYKLLAGLTAGMWNSLLDGGLVSASLVYRFSGHGSPEGVITAPPLSDYLDLDNDYVYIKKSGSGNTGWIIH